MHTIRHIQKARNGKVIIDLPAEFTDEEVEVIVSPVQPSAAASTRSPEANMAIQKFLQIEPSGFTEKQLAAYRQACE